MHIGDYLLSKVIYFKFTTRNPSTGAPFTLAGSPVVKVYKDNSTTTETTTGVTLTVDFDSVTGLNHVTIDTSADGTFYSSGSNFDVVITTGTVNGVSVVGEVIASFSLQKASSYDTMAVQVIPDSVAADGTRPTVYQALLELTRFLMEKSLSGTTLTVKKEDGATSSMTFTLNDGTNPTSITRAS